MLAAFGSRTKLSFQFRPERFHACSSSRITGKPEVILHWREEPKALIIEHTFSARLGRQVMVNAHVTGRDSRITLNCRVTH